MFNLAHVRNPNRFQKRFAAPAPAPRLKSRENNIGPVIPISVPGQHDGIKLYEEHERGREACNDAALRVAGEREHGGCS
jgi:hypothetical protein